MQEYMGIKGQKKKEKYFMSCENTYGEANLVLNTFVGDIFLSHDITYLSVASSEVGVCAYSAHHHILPLYRHCTLCRVRCDLYCAVSSVHCARYTVQCNMYNLSDGSHILQHTLSLYC